MSGTLFLWLLAVYAAAGLATAATFIAFGVERFSNHMTFTVPARLVLFPGAALLWPYVLYRWQRGRSGES